ncbi:MAG: ABC transporter ATP-binding protein [Deltaproteobacteria bacterium]|nr:MAG: ABC transporter ATP-binding protein [Deltaproteobacteria bacterium]
MTMGVNRDYFAEEKIGRVTDAGLMRRVYPFVRPYGLHLAAAVVFILAVTLIELAVPYVTKMAIDRYIVPVSGTVDSPADGIRAHRPARDRLVTVDMSDPAVRAVVEKYRDRFRIVNHQTVIRWTDLPGIEKSDIVTLRKRDLNGIARLTLIFLLLIVAGLGANFAHQLILEYTGQMIMHDLRMRLFTHIQSLSVRFFTKNPVGRLVTRVTNDVQNMHELFTAVIVFVFKDLFLLIGICIVLLSLNWQLALICFTVFPIVFFASFYFARQARDVYRLLRVKVAEINARLTETINGMRVIQLFRQEAASEQRFRRLNHENYMAGMRQLRIFALFMPFVGMLGTVALAVVIYFGGSRVLDDRITLGILVAFISYIRMFFRPIRDIAEKYNILQNAMSSVERLFLILDNSGQMAQPDPRPSGGKDGGAGLERIHRIEFDRVTFGYQPGIPVLEDIRLTINEGERVAVVGPTGSGKTSLINLLVRFYDPDSGRIWINGRGLTDYKTTAIRQRMALVTQDPFLFTGTIADNIRFGNAALTDGDLERAIENAHCTDLVAKLPGGTDFVLAGGKEALSSGERQLISIARAFARDPDLLILDEATSFIDSITEQHIQKALDLLMQRRTTLLVAHRLSTARKADRIVVISRGRIVETGTHEELIRQKGVYYRLGELQH